LSEGGGEEQGDDEQDAQVISFFKSSVALSALELFCETDPALTGFVAARVKAKALTWHVTRLRRSKQKVPRLPFDYAQGPLGMTNSTF
jgi:hypothetical protein